jgi:hypothetical protein
MYWLLLLESVYVHFNTYQAVNRYKQKELTVQCLPQYNVNKSRTIGSRTWFSASSEGSCGPGRMQTRIVSLRRKRIVRGLLIIVK